MKIRDLSFVSEILDVFLVFFCCAYTLSLRKFIALLNSIKEMLVIVKNLFLYS